MKILVVCIFMLASFFELHADEVILTNGKSISFRVLKDAGDQIEVQTVDNQTISIPKKDVKDVKLSIPKAPLVGATFVGDDTKASEKPVNLLAVVDPKKNGITGEWRASSAAIVGSGIGLLEIPYIPATSSYDIEIFLERKDGDDEIIIGLISGGKPFSITFDWGKGDCTGMTVLGGTPIFGNETKVSGKQIPTRKQMGIKCAVRDGRVVVMVDGKTIIDWKGDMKQLSHPGRTKEQNLFFGVRNTTVVLSRYVFTARQ